jgi:hypothetical protein
MQQHLAGQRAVQVLVLPQVPLTLTQELLPLTQVPLPLPLPLPPAAG